MVEFQRAISLRLMAGAVVAVEPRLMLMALATFVLHRCVQAGKHR